jgi:hypothetical protein
METRPIGNGSVLVTDDGAKYVGGKVSGARDPVYDPNPLPDMSGVTFTKEQKQAAWNLMKPDHTGK